jgi:ribosome biogenesis GTPase A
MAIQWFPGHMHLTRQAIADRIINRCGDRTARRALRLQRQPMLADLAQGRPALKILNKQDLADQAALWLYYNAMPNTRHRAGRETAPALPDQGLPRAGAAAVAWSNRCGC